MSELPKKRFSDPKMTDAATYNEEVRLAVILAGGDPRRFHKKPLWLAYAASRLGYARERAHGFYYRKIAFPKPWELDRAREFTSALQRRQQEGIQHGDTLRAATRGWASAWRGVAAVGSGDAVSAGEPVADQRGRATDESRQEVLTGWGFRLGRARGDGE